MYDEQGRLVGEYDSSGKLIQETVWMNDLPIATIRPKGANASTPLGITGTGAATANNLGTNTAANPVNVDFFYVHPDHLGTPRVVTKPADNKKVWEWQSQPFGEGAANENPQNLTGAALTAGQFRYNLRFPGQVYDAETAKHYNYFRDYDPSLGRYVESDPIGLRGGINTFGYVRGTPISLSDPEGLVPGDQWWGYNNKDFQKWFHRCWKQKGDPDASKGDIEDAFAEWVRHGSPKGGKCGNPPPPSPPPPAPTCGDNCKKIIVGGIGVVCIAACLTNPACAIALGIGAGLSQ
jgi:RHS repeat-associated protein